MGVPSWSAQLSLAGHIGISNCPVCSRELSHYWAMAHLEGYGWLCVVCQGKTLPKLIGVAKVEVPRCANPACGCVISRGQTECYSCIVDRERDTARRARQQELYANIGHLSKTGGDRWQFFTMLRDNPRVSRDEYWVLASILLRADDAGHADISVVQIADEWDLDASTVRQIIDNLVASGRLAKHRRPGKANTYELL